MIRLPAILLLAAALLPPAAPSAAGAEAAAAPDYLEPPLPPEAGLHWSFRSPAPPRPPGSDGSPIDAFLLESLRRAGLPDFAPQAPPETLLRRLGFVLTGLPPSPAEIEAFVSAWTRDPGSAWLSQIDRLLASPHHGERWAQHWLDLARFAETDGFEHDKVRGEAWRYRDWVVASLNGDLPYDQFVRWQIAGDLLAPGRPDAAATGFLLAGPDMPDLNLAEERRHQVLNGLTSMVGSAFLGLTFECAECHDHKSDPLSQADFYRLRAVFESFDLPKKDTSLPVVFPAGRAAEGRLYLRGDFRRPGPGLEPGSPRVLGGVPFSPATENPRLALAVWLTRPDHPLTARVLVNRVWQHHFGLGLVPTPSDFGKLGSPASHPELLDWLATEFVHHGWSLKWLHREILLTRAWRQASRRLGDGGEARADWARRLERDPENKLLSRRSRLRLDGESVRDAMLAASGRLNGKTGGPGIRPPLPPEAAVTLLKHQWPVTEDPAEFDRRSLYLFARRNLRFPLFEVLDRPDANQSCARRHVSTTAPQALTLLNDALVHDLAGALARRTASLPPAEAVRDQFLRVLGRAPRPAEAAAAIAFAERQPAASLSLALFNLNEFLYLD